DLHQHRRRLLLEEFGATSAARLRELLEVGLGLGVVTLAEVDLTARELRLGIVAPRVERFVKRFDRLVVELLLVVPSADLVPDVALLGLAGNRSHTLFGNLNRRIGVVPLPVQLGERYP